VIQTNPNASHLPPMYNPSITSEEDLTLEEVGKAIDNLSSHSSPVFDDIPTKALKLLWHSASSKAYDKVPHSIIIQKMLKLNFPQYLISWVASLFVTLHISCIHVFMSGVSSNDIKEPNCGILQGSSQSGTSSSTTSRLIPKGLLIHGRRRFVCWCRFFERIGRSGSKIVLLNSDDMLLL
jgi:hypothetical protein